MKVPTDLDPRGLRNWLQDAMLAAQREMGNYFLSAFGPQYENPLWRASQRRLFYMSRDRYEEAKKVMEGM